jgi:midasin
MSSAGASREERSRRPAPQPESNPFRNLGSAMERWRARLSVAGEAPEPEAGAEPEAAAAGGGEGPHDDDMEVEPPAAGEFRFLGAQEGQQAGDTQALAPATEDQAAAQGGDDPDDGGGADAGGMMDDGEEEDDGMMDVDPSAAAPPPPSEVLGGKANWGAGAGEKAGVEAPPAGADGDAPGAADEGGAEEGEAPAEREPAPDSFVISRLRAATLEDALSPLEEDVAQLLDPLTVERARALREELDRRLKAASEGGAPPAGGADAAHGREVWARCEALTAGLVGELTEQLRLLLEPTLASKLAGDYRTGKRINMRKVIGYIASHFRKDKIWTRRTRPDKRRYQVVVAVDDSRSMAETGCGGFALEALTLICRSMARLDVGELGVVSFGGGGGAQPLHALDRPFTDADGVRVMSRMRFDQDNTIADRPMTDLVTSLDHLLEGARARASAPALGPASLHQLVLIVADGRFHEKESLRRAALQAAGRPGVLYAFIVLDNPANSILDIKSVSFVGGACVESSYMDAFPFPFHIVLRDTAALPRTLADLLRQWFALAAQ